MANKNISKVVYGGKTLIDLTADTVTADKLLSTYTAHDKRALSSPVPAHLMQTPAMLPRP